MNVIAESPALKTLHTKPQASWLLSRAMLNSLCLHATALLLVILFIPHGQGVALRKKPVAVIALESLQQNHTLPGTAYNPPTMHRQRLASAKPLVRLPIKQTPPASTLWPLPAPPVSSVQTAVASDANLVPAAAHVAMPGAEASNPVPPTSGGAELNKPLPLAYLTEVSRMISVYLNSSKPRFHGVVVVHIRIARDGNVLSAAMVRSSGNQVLDEEALDVVLRIHRFPEPPSAYVSEIGDFNIDQPIRFLG